MSGATAVVLVIRGDQFACLWAGDSRCYILRDGKLYRLSLDHTVVREMLDRGMLSPENSADHPMRHVLSRVVGGEPNVDIDAVVDEWRRDDVFLLCSDGLTGLVEDNDIEAALGSASPQEASQRLLDLTLERGAPDNVTILVIRGEEATALRLEPAQ
jgi:serine/threonine protein phosphatase PrpC